MTIVCSIACDSRSGRYNGSCRARFLPLINSSKTRRPSAEPVCRQEKSLLNGRFSLDRYGYVAWIAKQSRGMTNTSCHAISGKSYGSGIVLVPIASHRKFAIPFLSQSKLIRAFLLEHRRRLSEVGHLRGPYLSLVKAD